MNNLFQFIVDNPKFVSTVISPIILILTLALKLCVELIKYLKTKNELSATGVIHTSTSKLKQEISYEQTPQEMKSLLQTELMHEQMKMLGIKDRRIHSLVLECANIMGSSFDLEDYRKAQELLTVNSNGELKLILGLWDKFEKYVVLFLFWIMVVFSALLFILAALLITVSQFIGGFTQIAWGVSFVVIISYLIIPTLQKYNAAKRVIMQLETIPDLKKEKQKIEAQKKEKTTLLCMVKRFLKARIILIK